MVRRCIGSVITLRSTNPLDRGVVTRTIIDGFGIDTVVPFSGMETAACTLSGFTIQNGYTEICGGGIYGHQTLATIENNIVTADVASGVNSCGGGLYECEGSIRNCILWENTAGGSGPQLELSSLPTYSCIQNWLGGGEGNTTLDPLFLDRDGPDDNPATYGDNSYRLAHGSPCIDKGGNVEWMWDAVDLDDNPRVFYGGASLTVDMGAYEYGSFHFKIVVIGFTTIPFPGGVRLQWHSRPGDTYTVWNRYDLSVEWSKIQAIPSQGDTTSYTVTGFMPIWVTKVFYRLELDLE